MQKSSLPVPNSHEPSNPPKQFSGDAIDQQWLADSLTAALSNGNLEQLAQTRQAFTKDARDQRDLSLSDLAALLERRSAPRSALAIPVSDDLLREQEEELKRAEELLERRRREVELAKRQAEEEAKRQIEAQRRAIGAEAQQRARESAERMAELEIVRKAAETSALDAARTEQLLNAEIDGLRRAEQDQLKRIAEAEVRLRDAVAACDAGEAQAKKYAAREAWLAAELRTLKAAEDEDTERLKKIESEILVQLEAKHRAEEAAKQREEQLRQINAEIAAAKKAGDEQQILVEAALARVAQLQADHEAAEQAIGQHTERERQLNAEIAACAEVLKRHADSIEQAKAQVAEQEKIRQQMVIEAEGLAQHQQNIRNEIAALTQRATEEALRHVLNEAQRQANHEESRIAELQQARAQTEAQARERAALAESLKQGMKIPESTESDAVLELFDDQHPNEVKAVEPVIERGSFESQDQVKEVAPDEVPLLQIDLEHTDKGNGASAAPHELTGPSAEPNSLKSSAVRSTAPAGLEPADNSAVSARIQQQLKSDTSTERAAALTDLAEVGGEEAFVLIAQSFDDPAVEVRNAAARALYDLNHDRAGSFTRVLREANPERRRKIGAAIAGSGLAVDAINSLSGEGRERTYDAYSLLFLMAKSGEVSPLMQAISRHSNLDVRLTSIKLLALSNQQQVLSSLRHLAARESLPPEVHSALMEAIYSISTQAREHAPSLA